ncbi:hypothetical protein SSABA_v1c04140 [Spiroplasma sabaudiense Ar-1343]|uniref:Putative endonuclease Z1 domain-containing protein n=1 Tax=Spiroplasma sabaudiense Ar-1343 TaxID=1276257 RepID=W6A9K5_9MOLU|nr:Z1 domain-containing protein [Spiroplasma sabaudiense]AHI53823.1 hypothetical protein SSABA_v1c04140 [Spiroplasma sabaudiense Ar-1343]
MKEKIAFRTLDEIKKMFEEQQNSKFKTQNYHNDHIFNFFKDLKSDENIEFNFENIKRSLTLDSFKDNKKTILLIGEVQSGKTRNMLKMLDYVLNEKDYHDVFWICGTNNNLLSQSIKRLRDEENLDLHSYEIGYLEYLKSKETPVTLKREIELRDKVLAVSLKNKLQLENLNRGITFADTLCSERNLLIIDDECDFMSLSKDNNSNEIKANHKLLMSLLNNKVYKKTAYVGVTATPYGNFNYERSKDLFPEEVVLLNRSKTEYTGLNWFNERSKDIYINLNTEKTDENQYTIDVAIINHAHAIYKNPKKFSEMLINIDLDILNHDIYSSKVNKSLRNWIRLYENNFQTFKIELNKCLKILNHPTKDIDTEVFYKIIKEIKKDEIFILNGDNSQNDKFQSGRQNAIIIGGVMVSRGYTFENLKTEIMINAPKAENKVNIGVLLQRARWFGYRRESEKYMRIILNSKIIKSYHEAEIVQSELFSFFGQTGVFKRPHEITEHLEVISRKLNYLEVK